MRFMEKTLIEIAIPDSALVELIEILSGSVSLSSKDPQNSLELKPVQDYTQNIVCQCILNKIQ